jgi:hypothetical protein
MLNLKNLLARTLLAFAMASGAGAALAGPTYHVDVDTSALAGSSGYLDFLFSVQGDAAFTTATLSHFTGNFSGDQFTVGGASGSAAAGGTVSTTEGWNELGLLASFGGHLGFDLSFEQATGNLIGSLFEVALLGADLNYLAPTAGDIAQFQLLPGAAIGLQASDFATISLGSVSDVPEPADAMLMITGLGLLGFTLRRRA